MSDPREITVTDYQAAREVFRCKDLRQALYDEGDVVMADVLVNLHGADHRARRRLENRLFRRDTHELYERELFPPVVAHTLEPHVVRGEAELVSLSHQVMMNLAASTAGIDRPLGTPEETFRLYTYMMRFIEGATLAHYAGDRDLKRAEVADALASFDEEFLRPSIARRQEVIGRVDAGVADEGELPRDVLTVLLRNSDQLELPDDVVLRETCFFLLAGAHTSATAFVRTADALFDLEPDPARRAALDRRFLQRCVHETVRLHPSSPVAMRWALAEVDLTGAGHVAAGDKVVVDLVAANRDPSVFGEDADVFDPVRDLASGVAPWGLSFGLGMHACIGQDLAAGIEPSGDELDPDHLFGLVPIALEALLGAGARRDPDRPATVDLDSARGYWSSYPIVFGEG